MSLRPPATRPASRGGAAAEGQVRRWPGWRSGRACRWPGGRSGRRRPAPAADSRPRRHGQLGRERLRPPSTRFAANRPPGGSAPPLAAARQVAAMRRLETRRSPPKEMLTRRFRPLRPPRGHSPGERTRRPHAPVVLNYRSPLQPCGLGLAGAASGDGRPGLRQRAGVQFRQRGRGRHQPDRWPGKLSVGAPGLGPRSPPEPRPVVPVARINSRIGSRFWPGGVRRVALALPRSPAGRGPNLSSRT
jgi:hypothetical protein